MKRGNILFLKVTIFIIGMVIVSFCIFWLPDLARAAAEMNPEYAYLRLPVLIGSCLPLFPFLFALYQAFKLLLYIENDNTFSELAVISLRHIKNCAFTIIIIYVIGVIFLLSQNALHPGIAILGFAIIFAALVIALFTAVLQELLRSTLEIKLENELTV
jgi:hypothetical protein